ncbi:MAG: hypothetical protein JXR68_01640 [Bacteroidales bacterium]|nr:hypothetical protein [Bacteroidales bacterium]
MKNKLFFILLISFPLFLFSCGSDNTSDYSNDNDYTDVTTDYYTTDDDDYADDDIIGDEYEFIGTYESKTGVMTDISCYCYQVGYFYATNGEDFVVCFPNGTEEPMCYENVKIDGYFQYVEITPDNNSACSAGGMEIFYVTDFECL